MKKTVLILIAFLCFSSIRAQNYINIGSSKEDVKKVMGEPKSIMKYEFLAEEVWTYGEYGLATITFKNEKLDRFNNYQNVLKIGTLNQNDNQKNEGGQRQTKKIVISDDFFDKIKNAEIKDVETIADGNISGITPANAKEVKEQKYDRYDFINLLWQSVLAVLSLIIVIVIVKKIPL